MDLRPGLIVLLAQECRNSKYPSPISTIFAAFEQTAKQSCKRPRGGMKHDLMKSMSEGVEKAAVVIALCTKLYQSSPNCQIELNYANDLRKPILPIICDKGYTQQQTGSGMTDMDPAKWPSNWLGAIIAGKVYGQLAYICFS